MQVQIKEIKDIEQNQKLTSNQWTWQCEGINLFQNILKERLTSAEREICKELIYQSIPCHLRGKVWMITSGAKEQMLSHPNYYKDLLTISQNIPSYYQKNIMLDIPRTIENNYEANGRLLNHLKNILICYSIRNTSIGYCQGFNFIVHKLYSIVKDEEEAFWLFCQLIEEILPLNYYSELIGIMADSAIVYGLIKVFFPQLYDYFVKNNFEPIVTNFVHKWFVGLFTQSFNEDTVDFIFDMLLLEGNSVLIQAALSILFLLEKNIIKIGKNVQGLFQLMNYNNDIINPVLLYPFFKNNIFKFPNEHLIHIRSEMRPIILESFNISSDNISLEIKVDYNGKCNTRYPYCLKVTAIDINKSGVECFVYSKGKINILQSYIDDLVILKHNDDKDNHTSSNTIDNESHFDVLVERRKHYCEEANTVNNNERAMSQDFGLFNKDRLFNLRSSKTMKSLDRESLINNRLSKLHLIAEKKFEELLSHVSIKPIVNLSNSMYIYGNELSFCSKANGH